MLERCSRISRARGTGWRESWACKSKSSGPRWENKGERDAREHSAQSNDISNSATPVLVFISLRVSPQGQSQKLLGV